MLWVEENPHRLRGGKYILSFNTAKKNWHIYKEVGGWVVSIGWSKNLEIAKLRAIADSYNVSTFPKSNI
jgi:hypothetical protein